jgi:HTH-type transcriptional regulator, sugar sensing transcriptional regulator
MSTPVDLANDHLVALGFTEIEAEAYIFLLRESPATGYRVAQGTGRTAANSYKALESLESRGAVMSEEGETRNYRAVPSDELLASLEKLFTKHRERAAHLLTRVRADHSDDRVYQLRTPSQVYERCRTILDSARQVVLLDIFTEPLAQLREAVERAAARGVRVAMLVYEPIVVAKAEVVLNHQASKVRGRWSGQWVNLAADSAEQVHALMTPDGSEVVHATWSASAFLAHLYQSGLLGELSASMVRNGIRAGESQKQILRRLHHLDKFEHADTPAFSMLTSPPLRLARPRGRKTR